VRIHLLILRCTIKKMSVVIKLTAWNARGSCPPDKLCQRYDIPLELKEVLAEHHITSESLLAGITDISAMHRGRA